MKYICCFLLVFILACKAKGPHNPYLDNKKKASEIIGEEHKKNEKRATRNSRKFLRKSKKKVYTK